MKRVVVVDHDVDVFNDRAGQLGHRDALPTGPRHRYISNARGSDLDPSTKEDGNTAKWGVDATAKPSLAAFTPRHRSPEGSLAAD